MTNSWSQNWTEQNKSVKLQLTARNMNDLNIVSLLRCVSNMKRIRKKKLFFQFFQVIESDPEDDLLEQATRPKYSRGPEMSTPTYSMDTDISTLEAPTFSTLNKGPSQTMMSLRWDHQVNEMGRRVSLFLFSFLSLTFPSILFLYKS